MKNTYFTFDGKVWHQKDGTAMGTFVAPVYAVLFLGAIEEKIWSDFDQHIVLNTRFIDDGFVVWNPAGDLAKMKQLSGLDSTKEQHDTSATILDLTVYWEGTKYLTRTHQKELNLYLTSQRTAPTPRES